MNTSRKPLHAFKLAAIAGALCALSSLALGDEVIMRDGTVHSGTIVSKTRRVVEIDTKIHGISTRLKLDRRRIKSIKTGDDAPSTLPTAPKIIDSPSIPTPASVNEVAEDTTKVLKREGYNLIMEVPMNGGFGEGIYPAGVADSLKWAKENQVTDVVFRINSPGGKIWCSNDIVTIIKEYDDEFKMHMLIESAISASIWPSFACDTITMTPGSDFGGAVVYSMNSTGSAEVDKKMNGIRAAKLETTADAKGHETLLVKAMTLSEASIYAYQQGGEWHFSNTTEGLPSDYETIDGPDTVLTLTAKQAFKYGLVDAMPNGKSLEEWAKVHNIEKWDSAGDIGTEIFEKAVKKSARLEDRLNATIRGFNTERAYLSTDKQTVATRGATLNAMKKHLGTYKRLIKEAKELSMPSIVDGYYAEAIDVTFWEAEIKTLQADLRRIIRMGP